MYEIFLHGDNKEFYVSYVSIDGAIWYRTAGAIIGHPPKRFQNLEEANKIAERAQKANKDLVVEVVNYGE